MNNSGKPIFLKYTADDLFFLVFNINIGLLPPFITLIANKALQIPLIITAVLIYFRLFVRPNVLNRFSKTLNDPIILLILALIGLLVFSALTVEYAENDQFRILLKPGLILLVMTTLRYSFSNRCELDQQRLGKFLLSGIAISLFAITCLTYWTASEWVQYLDNEFGLVKVNKLNRALEILSVLVFLCAISISDRFKAFMITILTAGYVYMLSFFVVGSAFWSGNWHSQVHVDSETVQFGMPFAFVIFILAHKLPRLITNLVFGGFMVVLLSAPWLYQLIYKLLSANLDPSMSVGVRKILLRGEIWDIVARKSLESPLFGFGIDSARYMQSIIVSTPGRPANIFLHPHNMILQLWLDLGFAGVVVVSGLILFGWRFLSRNITSAHPAALGGLTMLFIYSIVTHSLWQTWSISLFTIFFALVSILLPGSSKSVEPS